VVINDFNGFRASVLPEEAQAELVVDADAVLTSATGHGNPPDRSGCTGSCCWISPTLQ
jgi:hypothetical protein